MLVRAASHGAHLHRLSVSSDASEKTVLPGPGSRNRVVDPSQSSLTGSPPGFGLPASGKLPGRGRPRRRLRLLALALVLGSLVAGGAVWTNAFDVGDRFERLAHRLALILEPVPDRPTVPTITMNPLPSAATPPPTAGVLGVGPVPHRVSPTAAPTPTRRAVDMQIVPDPAAVFASEQEDVLCAPAGVQITLAILGLGDTSAAFQYRIDSRIHEWESWRDSHDGGWGPAAIVEALDAYGAHGYEVRAYSSRADALRDAASALTQTREPVLLMAWYGAHTWVMSGYRAAADPTVFGDATVTGAYILDPWYPRVSTIWGPSDPPGTFQNAAEIVRNYLPWKRPEGRYPDRDGEFIAVVPTLPASSIP